MRFNARIDRWVKWVFFLIVFMYVPILFIVDTTEDMYWIAASMGVTAIIVLPLIMNAHYDLEEDRVRIILGYIIVNIKYDDIKSIEIHDKWAGQSSLSLSKYRVRIRKHRGGLLGIVDISPKDREEFVYQLRMMCNNLEQKEF
jgi:hypothetical protein